MSNIQSFIVGSEACIDICQYESHFAIMLEFSEPVEFEGTNGQSDALLSQKKVDIHKILIRFIISFN